jgi:hypothetical protein
MRMMLARRPGPAVLRVTVARGDAGRAMGITVDGDTLGQGRPVTGSTGNLIAVDYAIPSSGAQGRPQAEVIVTALQDDAVVYEMRMMTGTEAVQPVA